MIDIGKTYLDTTGRKHTIQGFVRVGFHQVDQTKVWSAQRHFYIKNGKSVNGGHHLVVLPREKEIKYWQAAIAQLHDNNSGDKLALVQREIDNIHERLEELNKNSC